LTTIKIFRAHFVQALSGFIFAFVILFGTLNAQSIPEYYEKQNYKDLVIFARGQNQNNLSARDCYMTGYAHFQLGHDLEAVGWYEKAGRRGLDEPYLHFYKGLAYRYNQQYERSLASFQAAVKKEPNNQEYHAEMAGTLIEMELPDSALAVLHSSLRLQETYPKVYYLIGSAMLKKDDWKGAWDAFQTAKTKISEGDTYHVQSLIESGRICYSKMKDYECAKTEYRQAIALRPDNYSLYRSMIKACYALEDWAAADSFFLTMKAAYDRGELSEELSSWKGVAVDEFDEGNFHVLVIRHFDKPDKAGSTPWQFYVTVEKGLVIERKIQFQLSMGPKGKLDVLRLTAQYPDRFEDYGLEFPPDVLYPVCRENAIGILKGIIHARHVVPVAKDR